MLNTHEQFYYHVIANSPCQKHLVSIILSKNIVRERSWATHLTSLKLQSSLWKAKLKTHQKCHGVRVCECFQNHKVAGSKPCVYGEGHGGPLQGSRLENPMDRGVCWLQSTGSQRVTRLKQLSTHTYNSQTSARIYVTWGRALTKGQCAWESPGEAVRTQAPGAHEQALLTSSDDADTLV